MKAFTYLTIVILSISWIIGCGQQKKDPDKNRIEAANDSLQKSGGAYTPTASQEPGKTHMGIIVHFDNNVFTMDTLTAGIRPGRLPYLESSGKPFAVIYKDINGKILGRYNIEDPTSITSCDVSGKPFTKKLAKGSFELLLPNNKEIATVEFTEGDKRIGQLNVRGIGYGKKDNNPSDTLKRKN